VRHIIVDGYNVIRADPRLQSFERVSLEQAREVLVKTLASSPRLANDRLTIVFDGGRGSRPHIHSERHGRVVLIFSAQGQTADDVIVRQARTMAGGDRVVVVSNDVELRERCRAAGCEVSAVENLLNQLPGAPRRLSQDNEVEVDTTLSTVKRGNPRRSSRRARRQREVRF
jgi:predicted RNA-binding protein with PIN domain